MLTLVCFVCMYGDFVSFGNVLTPLFGDQFTPAQISVIGVIFVITGVIGCFLIGVYIDKTGMTKRAVKFITLVTLILFITGMYLLSLGVFWVTCLLAVFLGMALIPVLPAGYALAAKVASNFPPNVVNGLMMSVAQVYSFIVSYLMTWLLSYGKW